MALACTLFPPISLSYARASDPTRHHRAYSWTHHRAQSRATLISITVASSKLRRQIYSTPPQHRARKREMCRAARLTITIACEHHPLLCPICRYCPEHRRGSQSHPPWWTTWDVKGNMPNSEILPKHSNGSDQIRPIYGDRIRKENKKRGLFGIFFEKVPGKIRKLRTFFNLRFSCRNTPGVLGFKIFFIFLALLQERPSGFQVLCWNSEF